MNQLPTKEFSRFCDNYINKLGKSFSEDVNKRYEAYGWQTLTVSDVNDLDALRHAIVEAQNDTSRPSLIKVKTVIGFGSQKQGTEKVQGAALGAEDIAQCKEAFGFDPKEV